MVTETATSVLGPKKKVHQDWFDENDEVVQALLDEKRKAFIDWQNHPNCSSRRDRYNDCKARAQRELRSMQNQWWERKADEVQLYADSNNSKMLFSAIKTIYGPSASGTAPLLSADGTTIIKDKEGISARWEEHFSQLLNRPSTVDQAALEQIPQKPTHEDLDLPPTEDEVRAAIKQMNCGKAQGKDGLPAEIFKALGDTAFQAFHDVLCTIWEDEDMPADLRDATIVALYKNKGAKADCGNYRGISLLSIAGKTLARILLNRLIENISEDNLPEAQCGFRPGRSTIDMVFTVRQIQEKCSEQQMDLYAVLSNGEHSSTFAISNGVKQGCVLAPVLFNLFFTQVLLHAVKDLNLGVYIKYRLEGSLFDLRRLSARRKTLEKLILEALFADDCALMAHKENHLQVIVDRFADAARLFGLTISLGKTEALVQPAPNTSEHEGT